MEKRQIERLFKVLEGRKKLFWGYRAIATKLPQELVLQAVNLFYGKTHKRNFYSFVRAVLIERYRNGSKLVDAELFDKLMVYLINGSLFRSHVVELVLDDLSRANLIPAEELEYYHLNCEVINAGLGSGAQLSRYIREGKLNNPYKHILGDVTTARKNRGHHVIDGVAPKYYKRLCRALGFEKDPNVRLIGFVHKNYGTNQNNAA